mgnify:CR=1 FL=1
MYKVISQRNGLFGVIDTKSFNRIVDEETGDVIHSTPDQVAFNMSEQQANDHAAERNAYAARYCRNSTGTTV